MLQVWPKKEKVGKRGLKGCSMNFFFKTMDVITKNQKQKYGMCRECCVVVHPYPRMSGDKTSDVEFLVSSV